MPTRTSSSRSGGGRLGFGAVRPPDPASAVFGALADPTRRSLVEALAKDGDATATQLASSFPVTRQAVAKHLGILAEAGLVSTQRVGREQRYRLDPTAMAVAARWMESVGSVWDLRLTALRRHLKG